MSFLDYTGTSRLVNKILAKINALSIKIDNLSNQTSSGVPAGTISWFANSSPPKVISFAMAL